MSKTFTQIFAKFNPLSWGEDQGDSRTYETGVADGIKVVLEILEAEAKRGTANASYLIKLINEKVEPWV
jgi:hypothetical protein